MWIEIGNERYNLKNLIRYYMDETLSTNKHCISFEGINQEENGVYVGSKAECEAIIKAIDKLVSPIKIGLPFEKE
jgi:hypothetical protein